MLLSFGQPAAGIMQMAFVVKDIHQAIDEWVEKLKVGPWFLLDDFTGIDPIYRGEPSEAHSAIAMSFAGHMNIELIQPKDTKPSVYKEWVDSQGYGFHHWGVASSDVDADIKRYEKMGMKLAFRAGVPTGGEVAYLDTGGAVPGFLEVIQTNPVMEQIFAGWYGMALAWDGTNRIRPFI